MSGFHVGVALDGAGWHPAAWRDPSARPKELFTAGYWASLAQTAEQVGAACLWAPEHVVLTREYTSRYPYSDDGSFPLMTMSVTNYLPGVVPPIYPPGIGGFKMVRKGCKSVKIALFTEGVQSAL